jgi:hypothetical protein
MVFPVDKFCVGYTLAVFGIDIIVFSFADVLKKITSETPIMAAIGFVAPLLGAWFGSSVGADDDVIVWASVDVGAKVEVEFADDVTDWETDDDSDVADDVSCEVEEADECVEVVNMVSSDNVKEELVNDCKLVEEDATESDVVDVTIDGLPVMKDAIDDVGDAGVKIVQSASVVTEFEGSSLDFPSMA